MLPTVHQPPLKMRATMAAADTYCAAVALRERFAAFVSFQWHQPSHSPHKNVISADTSLLPPAISAEVLHKLQQMK